MATDKVVLEYDLQIKGGDKVIATIDDIEESSNKAGKALTSALSEKQIDSATEKLNKFNTTVEKTATEFSSAKAELNSLTKEITSGKLQGKDLELAKKRAGELKDRIGDVREEIARLASDTRVFDTLVEGARGVAAAFSVAQGAAGLFGDESKDLQKAILKTQSALALLTGVQELATIATKEGGIATKAMSAIQAGYTTVVGTSTGALKLFRLALAATGIGLAVVAVGALVANWDKLTASVKKFLGIRTSASDDEVQAQIEAVKNIQQLYDDEIELKRAAGEKTTQLELQRINDLRNYLSNVQGKYKENSEFFKFQLALQHELNVKEANLQREIREKIAKDAKEAADKNLANDKAVIEEQLKLQKEFNDAKQKEIDEARARNDEARAEELKKEKEHFERQQEQAQAYLDAILEAEQKAADQRRALMEATFAAAAQTASSLASIGNSILQQETNNLQIEKDKQLAIAGEDSKKKEKIEKDFAVKMARIKRQAAIIDRAAAIFNIGITLAKSIQAIQAQAAVLASNPATAALAGNAYAQIGIAAAMAAVQTAAVLAQPLPEIPKFKEGVVGFKGKGTETSDENLVLISNNESVIKAKATSKYRDELQAANDLNLESFIYHKYLLPVLQKAGDAERDSSQYDDWLLRRTIKAGHEADRKNSQYIVNGILSGMRDSNRASQRHYA